MKKNMTKLAWLIWFIVALFYFYEYILRSAPSIMLPSLENYFGLSSLGLGVLLGCYYYSYAPLQLVAGALLDKFGAKRVVPFAAALCAVGSLLFIVHNVYAAGIGRLLMGAGSAFAFVGVTYVATTWIPAKRHSLVFGLTQTMGMLGGIVGESFLVKVAFVSGWKVTWVWLAVAAFVLLVLLYLVIPRSPQTLIDERKSQGGVWKNYKIVLSNPTTWLAGCIGGFLFAPTTIFVMLWGIPFFKLMYHFNDQQAAWINSVTLLGWVIGSPLSGLVADWLKNKKIVLLVSSLLVLVLFLLAIYVHMPKDLLIAVMFLSGLFSGAQILCFAIAKAVNPDFTKGSVVGGTNFLVFIWAAILTPLSSRVLTWIHPGVVQNYNISDFQHALWLVVGCLVLAVVLSVFLRHKKSS